MASKIFKTLILILAIGSGIQLSGQTVSNKPIPSHSVTPPCSITLPCTEYDFYAQKLVEFRGLSCDTSILNNQLRSNAITIHSRDRTIYQMEAIIQNDSLSALNQNKIINVYKNDYDILGRKYSKEVKKSKRRGEIALIAVIVGLIEGIVLVLKH